MKKENNAIWTKEKEKYHLNKEEKDVAWRKMKKKMWLVQCDLNEEVVIYKAFCLDGA